VARPTAEQDATAHGNHFSCSLSAVMIARLHDHGGDEAVARLLREAGCARPPDYLLDTGNWISYAEALLRAADTAMFACKRARRSPLSA
jgi:hypothetical protein